MQLYTKSFETRLARFSVICDDSNIIRLSFTNDNCGAFLGRYLGGAVPEGENELCRLCEEEVSLFLEGKLKKLSAPARLYGTPFELAIWNALSRVPYGRTTTYAGIAKLAGAGGARAAGGALAKNPLPLYYPCHRVIKADGGIGGFCGGLSMTGLKSALLELEAANAGRV